MYKIQKVLFPERDATTKHNEFFRRWIDAIKGHKEALQKKVPASS